MSDPPAGAPPWKSRTAAYRELMESLWYASKTFRDEGDGGIEGAKIACKAVARLIGVRHENPELAAPFLALRAALEDVERGVQPELFSHDPSLKKRSRSSQRKHLQMLASVALDVLMFLGESQDQAANRVSRAVLAWPGFAPGTVTAVTIRHWRDQILSQRPDERTQFDKLRRFILSRPDPRHEVEKLLKEQPGVAKT
jgi:hypothetical protein